MEAVYFLGVAMKYRGFLRPVLPLPSKPAESVIYCGTLEAKILSVFVRYLATRASRSLPRFNRGVSSIPPAYHLTIFFALPCIPFETGRDIRTIFFCFICPAASELLQG